MNRFLSDRATRVVNHEINILDRIRRRHADRAAATLRVGPRRALAALALMHDTPAGRLFSLTDAPSATGASGSSGRRIWPVC
jgi:hypothetical protein